MSNKKCAGLTSLVTPIKAVTALHRNTQIFVLLRGMGASKMADGEGLEPPRAINANRVQAGDH